MRRLLLACLVVAAWACAATPATVIEPASPAVPSTRAAATGSATVPTSPAVAQGGRGATPPAVAPEPSAAGAASSVTPSRPGACPPAMALVDGDYCSEVEHTCRSQWFDKSNKKDICEEFAPGARCVGARTRKRYCIDEYAWPNRRGARPEVMNTFYQAQVKCAAVGKRMCTESEWTLACEGPEMKPFPYGYRRDARKCNGDHEWDRPDMDKVARRDPDELARLWRGVPSGSQPECISDYGVADLPANTDEVVASESSAAKHDSVNTGGPWYKGVRNQCRPKIYTHDEGFYYYYLGFRCCAEADGQATDPRTPKQRKKGTALRSIERLAGFGVERTRQALALAERGLCQCPPPDEAIGALPRDLILCKTLCGTTLGPGAHDGDDSTRLPPGKR